MPAKTCYTAGETEKRDIMYLGVQISPGSWQDFQIKLHFDHDHLLLLHLPGSGNVLHGQLCPTKGLLNSYIYYHHGNRLQITFVVQPQPIH